MNFQFASDLHIEFNGSDDPLHYITPSADNLILAGDVCSCNDFERFKSFIQRTCELFKIVIFVAGNHEYYKYPHHENFYSITEINIRLKSLNKNIKNFYFLDKDKLEIENICIAGCTLWTNINFKIPTSIVKIKDINTELYNDMNLKDIEFLKTTIEYCKNEKKKLIIVTHYPPLIQSENFKRKYKFKDLYYNDLREMIFSGGINTWIFGHTHLNLNLKVIDKSEMEVNFLCNQKGKGRFHTKNYDKGSVLVI